MVDDSEAAILDGLNSNAWNTAPLDNFQAVSSSNMGRCSGINQSSI